jgi:hypothetical protein
LGVLPPVLVDAQRGQAAMRRYIGLDVLTKGRLHPAANTEPEEVTLTAITA